MKTALLFSAFLATGLFAATAQAQNASTNGSAAASAEAAVQGAANTASIDALAQRYAEAAGSLDAATGLVNELRDGTAGRAAMGYAEIDSTLALASKLVADGKAASLDGAVDAVLDLRADGLTGNQLVRSVESKLGSATSTVNDATSQLGQTVRGVSSGVGVGASGQAGVDVRTDQGNARIDVGGTAAGRSEAARPAAELRGNGGIGVGADVRPNLPVLRPLLGN